MNKTVMQSVTKPQDKCFGCEYLHGSLDMGCIECLQPENTDKIDIKHIGSIALKIVMGVFVVSLMAISAMSAGFGIGGASGTGAHGHQHMSHR